MTGKLRQEIQQRKPFRSVQEEVTLALARTADRVAAPMVEVLRGANLSASQYNVLRILRGAGEEGLPCGEIAQRMVQRDPDLTRLLDRMESRALVTRSRGLTDRRVVRATIAREGLDLLASIEGDVDASHKAALAHVSVQRLRALLDILEEIREERK